jgi:hypothetical protein
LPYISGNFPKIEAARAINIKAKIDFQLQMIKITLAIAVLLFGVEALNYNANLKQLAMTKSKGRVNNKANLKSKLKSKDDDLEETF